MSPDWADSESSRADALMRRYSATGDPEILYDLLQLNVHGQWVPDRPLGRLYLVAVAGLLERFNRTDETRYRDKAVEMLRGTAPAWPASTCPHCSEGDSELRRGLRDLAASLRTRFERRGDVVDLHAAVELGRRAVATTAPGHPDHAGMLSDLGNSLLDRGDRDDTSSAPDLDEAIQCFRRALAEETSTDLSRARYLLDLSSALQSRFARTENPASRDDLDEAVDANQQALALLPAGASQRAGIHGNLSRALQWRFGRYGEPDDLDRAIEHARQATQLMGQGDLNLRQIREALGDALRSRFEWGRDRADLDEAIAQLRLVVAAVPAGHPLRSAYMQRLSSTLLVRFGVAGDMADFTESATCVQPEAEVLGQAREPRP